MNELQFISSRDSLTPTLTVTFTAKLVSNEIKLIVSIPINTFNTFDDLH